MSSAAYNQEEIHMQLFEAVEKGDLNTLKTLLEPPLSVDVIVFLFSNLSLKMFMF